jgi:DNA/RNA endonuclease G (NUC1)
MKKFVLFPAILLLVIAWLGYRYPAAANTDDLISTSLVISQFQAGRASPNFEDEFIEIHNVSQSNIDLNGYRLVYRSQNGQQDVATPFAVWTTSTVIPPGGYYLIASTSYDGSVPPDITYNPAACSCSMSGNNGGLAIRNGPNNTGTIIDSVAWGTVTNGFNEGTPTTPHPIDANDNSKVRLQNGCQDTDNNANDFATLTPATPRNSAGTPFICSGGGTQLFATMSANPSSVPPGSTTLLTVNVLPATKPPSTGIAVSGDLTDIGGASLQVFYDDGTHGDVTPGDNIFSFLATVSNGTTVGLHVVTAVASDLEGRTAPVQTNVNVSGTFPNEDPLLFGNPSNALPVVENENNYLMVKAAYSMSYNRGRNEANWVAWRLDSSWIGSANDGNFAPDTTLPAGWYQVQPFDYTGSGYDRGHTCPSGDRTNTQTINDQTFLMTNIMPQLPANNQGPWVDLEIYCRSLAQQGNELYIIAGGHGNIGTVGSTQQNRIVVPAVTWKVVLVLPNGSGDLQRANKATRVFGVVMSNSSISQSAPWRNFRVTVDAVEYLTGFDFFSAIPKNTQEIIERRRDRL